MPSCPCNTGGTHDFAENSGSKGAGSSTLALVRVERGLRRLTWLVSLLWLLLALAAVLAEAKASGDPLGAISEFAPHTLWAALPWVVFFVGRWVVRGFREDR